MKIWQPLTRPPLRTLLLVLGVLGIIGLVYLIYSPGKTIRDGRHDLGQNGIWLQHGWLGHDNWFDEHGRDRSTIRNDDAIEELASLLNEQRITYLFPHLCPCHSDGRICEVDAVQTERFLNHFPDSKVIPWVGGVLHNQCSPESPGWRRNFVQSSVALLDSHPRLAGLQINIEPLPSGNFDFLLLLDELKAALPPDKILSVAAYPPPTRWHPFPEVHWEESYFREVARRCDLIAPMMYDTAIRFPKLYQSLMRSWTREVLDWSGDTPVLLGLPAYDDADTGYHRPDIENLEASFPAIHAGLLGYKSLPKNYLGVALYSEWEMEGLEWKTYEREFRK
jgi:hypothetical protein